MNIAKHLIVFSILIISVLAPGCSNVDEAPAKSRDIKFEVTGDFSGTITSPAYIF